MKKIATAVLSVLTAGILILSLAGCTFFSPGSSAEEPGGDDPVVTPDPGEDPGEDPGKGPEEEPDLPDDIGGSDWMDWEDVFTGGSTEAYRLYQEAKEDGFEGTFVDFLKEIGYTVNVDSSVSVGTAVQSVVAIDCVFERELTNPPIPDMAPQEVTYSGAGVIYSLDKEAGDAYIITNYHVVYEQSSVGDETIPHISDDIRVYLYGEEYLDQYITAEYVGGAMDYDIAVIRIEDSERLKNSAARAVTAGDSDQLTAGETVYAIGNAAGAGTTVTRGVVSVPAEYIDILSADESKTLSLLEIRIDAAINHGNSGGGLFNLDGTLVGIVNARSEESGIRDFGYAIPINLAIGVAQNIIDNSFKNTDKGAYRATLGVTVQVSARTSIYDEESGSSYVVEKITVKEVTPDTPAAGKLEVGDLITGIRILGGTEKTVTRLHTVTSFMFNVRHGDTVVISYERDGISAEARITYNKNSMFTLFA